MKENKKPFYFRWWIILVVVIAAIGLLGSIKEAMKKTSEQKATYSWSENALTDLIPKPDSKYGRVSMENENYFSINIYKITKKYFEEYVEECKDYGFTVDYMKYDNYYSSNNEDEYSLSLSYDEKEKTLMIALCAPEESGSEDDIPKDNAFEEGEDEINLEKDSTMEEKPEKSEELEAAKDSDNRIETTKDIRPEFKEVLDGYEAFMSEYFDFIKKYTDSNNDIAMAEDYMKLLAKEIEWTEKIESLEDEEMNDEELKYYMEVTLRVSQKMLEIT